MTTKRELEHTEAGHFAQRGKDEKPAFTTEVNCMVCGQRLETATYMDGPHIKVLVDTRCRCKGGNA